MLIKICGLSTPDTMQATIDAGADWIGLVFFPKSPRHVSFEKAAELAAIARGKVKIVALTVNADDALLADIMASAKPDMIQFHGSETPACIAEVKAKHGVEAMKAIGVRSAEDLASYDDYATVCDTILLDAKPPKDAKHPGGNGVTFDWSLLDQLKGKKPFMLSGGLTLDNVSDAVSQVRPHGLDLSSGVESAPGIKDVKLIQAFIGKARDAAALATN